MNQVKTIINQHNKIDHTADAGFRLHWADTTRRQLPKVNILTINLNVNKRLIIKP